MADKLSARAALTLPAPSLPPSRTDEKWADATCPGAGTTQKAARCLQEHSSKKPLTVALQQQPVSGNTPHDGNCTRSVHDTSRSGSSKGSNSGGNSSSSSSSSTGVPSFEATSRGEGAASKTLKVKDSLKGTTPFSTRGAPTPQVYANTKQQLCCHTSNSDATARKTPNPVMPPAVLSPAVDRCSTPSSQPGRAKLLSSSRCEESAPTSLGSAKHSLLGSLLMPDGVTVRKPPPLGISSGDPIGTHILRRRAASMRTVQGPQEKLSRRPATRSVRFYRPSAAQMTEKFPSSGLNLSLHRQVAANNSTLSWQRSFQSAPRGAASFSSYSSSACASYNRRARGSSFMGRPIESLSRLVAFSPSLSKALRQQAHLIPAAPRVVDSADVRRAAVGAASLSTADAASPAATPATSRGVCAEFSSPLDAASFRGAAAVSLPGTRAHTEPRQDKEGKATEAQDAAGSSRNEAVATAQAFKEGAAKNVGHATAPDVEVSGKLEGYNVLDGETATGSYCTASTPGRVCYSSSVDSSSSSSEVRRRVGGGVDERLLKSSQTNNIRSQHPTGILSHTTDRSHSGSSNSSSEDSSTSGSKGDRIRTSVSSSGRKAACLPFSNENAAVVQSEVSKPSTPLCEGAAGAGGNGAPITAADICVPPSGSSSRQMIEVMASRAPAGVAPSVASDVGERMQERARRQQREQQGLSPALLYQLGITKFTEGKAPEAIEAITEFLRDAAAKKRRQQRQTTVSSGNSFPTEPDFATVTTVEAAKGRGAVVSDLSAEKKVSIKAISGHAEGKQQGHKKGEELAARPVSIDDHAVEGGAESEASKIQDVDPSSGGSVGSVTASCGATTGQGAAAFGDHTWAISPLEEMHPLRRAYEETYQQEERETEAHLRVQAAKETARGNASCKGSRIGKESRATEGDNRNPEVQHVRPVQQLETTAAKTADSPQESQESRRDSAGETPRGASPAENDVNARLHSCPNPTPSTLCGSTQGPADDAAAPDSAAADATAVDAAAAGARAAGGSGADASATAAVDVGTADMDDRGDTEGKKEEELCPLRLEEGVEAAAPSVSIAGAFDHEAVSVQGNDQAEGGLDRDREKTGADRGEAVTFEALEVVPVQKLFGVVFGRRLQIDRRAKDLIAGWGNPQYLHLEKLLGHLLFEEGNYPEAVRHYWRCIDLRPDDSQLYTNLGLAYYEMGAMEEATASFEQALNCNDRNPVALSVLAMLLMDKFEDAEEELSHQEAENAENEEVTRADETRHERLLKGTDRCVTLLKRCVEVEEDNVLAVLHLAQIYMYREEWDKAEAIFRALLQENADDTHLLNNLGQIAMYKGDMHQALQLFERALQINPQDELAHMHMCEAFCRLQHLGRALQHFCLCCEAAPDSVSLHATCGLPLCEAGKEREVVAAYTNFIKQHPESAAAKTFKRSLGSSNDQVGFAESSQIIVFIVVPILLLMVFLVGFTQLVSYWSSPTDDRSLPTSWESIYYTSPSGDSS